MIPVLFRVPEWIPLVGDQAITSFGSLLLIALLVAGWLFVRRLRLHDTNAAGWLVFVVLRREEGRRNESRMAGWPLFGLFLLLGGASRSLVELIRVKRDVLAGPITVDFLLALAVVALGAALWLRAQRRPGRWIRGKQSAQPSEVA